MRKLSRVALVATIACGFASPVLAETEAECEAAIQEVETFLAEDAAMPTGKAEEVETILAQAGEAGVEGNYAECLEIVEQAKGAAGISE